MRYRIMAAWKVLRGEWVAHPRVQFPSAWIQPGITTTANIGHVTWKTVR